LVKEDYQMFKKIKQEFLFGGHLQSLGAAAIVYLSCVLLKTKVGFDILLTAYFIFYAIYVFDRFKGIEKDILTNKERSLYLKKNLKLFPFLILFSVLIAFFLLIYFGNFKALLFGFILLTLGLIYSSLFKKITKKIPFFKNIYVSLFFTSLVFFPLVYFALSFNPSLYLLALFVFSKSLAMQFFLDIKDVKGDKKEKLITLPVLLGKEKSLLFLKIFSVLTNVFLFFLPQLFLSLLIFIPFNFYCSWQSKKEKYFSYLLASGEFLLWAIIVLIAKMIV